MASAMVQMNVRITPEMHRQIRDRAHREQTSVTAVVTGLLATALQPSHQNEGTVSGKGKA